MRRIIIISILLLLTGVLASYLVPTPKRSIHQLYRGKDNSALAKLDSLRRLPLNQIEVEGVKWKYLVAGRGTKPILLLHGMAGAYDIWWQQIEVLKDDYKIISITYPEVPSLKKIGDGLTAILNKEDIERTSVIGSSLGGYITQYLLVNYPERIDRAVFGNTFSPNDLYERDNDTKASILRLLPDWLVMKLLRDNLKSSVLPAADNEEVISAYLLEGTYGRMNKGLFYARYRCVIDQFAPSGSNDHQVLIIESLNDPLIYQELREKLKLQYPSAKVFTFENAGHFPYLNRPNEYNKVLLEFLAEVRK